MKVGDESDQINFGLESDQIVAGVESAHCLPWLQGPEPGYWLVLVPR